MCNGNQRNQTAFRFKGSTALLRFSAEEQYVIVSFSRRSNSQLAGAFRKELLQLTRLWKDRRCDSVCTGLRKAEQTLSL